MESRRLPLKNHGKSWHNGKVIAMNKTERGAHVFPFTHGEDVMSQSCVYVSRAARMARYVMHTSYRIESVLRARQHSYHCQAANDIQLGSNGGPQQHFNSARYLWIAKCKDGTRWSV